MSYGFEGWGGGFADPLVDGNGELIIPAIQSPNFDLGAQTGWAIMQNGDAYFFNITATGSVTAQSVIVHGSTGGVFIYSGTPMAGNLIVSIAGAAGIDPYGNVYPQGLDVTMGTISGTAISGGTITGAKIVVTGSNGEILGYSGTPAFGNLVFAVSAVAGSDGFGNSYAQGVSISNGTSSVVIGETGGSPLIYTPTGRTGITNSSAIQTITQGSGVSGYEQIQIIGSEDTANNDIAGSTWLSSSPNGAQSAQVQHFYKDPSGTFHTLMESGFFGTEILGGALYAIQPGTGTTRSNVAVAEAWHTLVLTSAFTSNAQDQAPRYRMEGIAGGTVRLDGVPYTVNASTAAGTTIATLPVGYRPTIRKRATGVTNYSGNVAGGTLFIVNPSGTITTGPASTAAGNQLVMDGFTFPVD